MTKLKIETHHLHGARIVKRYRKGRCSFHSSYSVKMTAEEGMKIGEELATALANSKPTSDPAKPGDSV